MSTPNKVNCGRCGYELIGVRYYQSRPLGNWKIKSIPFEFYCPKCKAVLVVET